MAKGGLRCGAGRPGYRLKDIYTRSIDVRRWQRDGLLSGGYFGWQWTDSDTGEVRSNIGVYPKHQAVELSYTVDGHSFRPLIQITTTPCAFGGSRVWFQCLRCHGRCAKLFLRGGHFRCRKCNQISYQSQSEDVIGRMWIAQAKIENRLGGGLARPKFMRQKTYDRLRERYWDLEMAREDAFCQFAMRLGFPW